MGQVLGILRHLRILRVLVLLAHENLVVSVDGPQTPQSVVGPWAPCSKEYHCYTVMYPIVSTVAFQSFPCYDFGEDGQWLMADVSVQCAPYYSLLTTTYYYLLLAITCCSSRRATATYYLLLVTSYYLLLLAITYYSSTRSTTSH